MYFGTARLFDGGHESTGVPAGAQSWFLAEGATGPFFETFVLIGNPNPAVATVVVTFLTDGGQTVVRNKTVPANGRLTINIESEDPILANAAVSTAVVASQPVVVERAMYWPGPPSTWAEAHNSFGSTVVSARWGLAEGRVGMDHGFETYILLANPNTTAANVQITFLRANGSTVVKTFTVNPSSRFNVAVKQRRAGAAERGVRRADRGDERPRDRRRARDVFERARPDRGRPARTPWRRGCPDRSRRG